MDSWEIAQVNIALPTVPLTQPELKWFVDALEPVNAVADAAPGFRWRLQTEDGDATAVRAFGDDRIIVNMSTWASIEALADFAYRNPEHLAVLRRKREGFERLGRPHMVLWWVPAGHRPTVAEAEQRLDHLREHGPTPWAFTFRQPFPAPGAEVQASEEDWYCRA
ncbi:DUF3291 domain-containing protein [Amycolatopsis suaedae]|uniref:DUF3291 domain-containing protein n=1 Tax=Amycolatopsis suaedae TaxID=2510978 RepID=A0A4Q7JAM8_9PSEU|nr:DUF3291 domain-containing protein [Amycolatopsis suaedae]RZQ63553.1 DUF3291 domain-containing protein [Amycolatopsis suaedae]